MGVPRIICVHDGVRRADPGSPFAGSRAPGGGPSGDRGEDPEAELIKRSVMTATLHAKVCNS